MQRNAARGYSTNNTTFDMGLNRNPELRRNFFKGWRCRASESPLPEATSVSALLWFLICRPDDPYGNLTHALLSLNYQVPGPLDLSAIDGIKVSHFDIRPCHNAGAAAAVQLN
ncbi:hypothetical protein BJY01DRAFT_203972 [Aspergillus pseudoustus]|uniref:Uncharacterized protein n=1 Tax=Aspergillus pseudoustus TaxID=1810923 RepID=A0ABR4KUD3_9EURO